MAPTRRRALPADERHRLVQKNISSGTLDAGGKAPPAQLPARPDDDDKVKIPPVHTFEPEEITIPLKAMSRDRALQLMRDAGPPDEWSGSVAAALGKERRAVLQKLWGELEEDERESVKEAFQARFKRHEDPAPPDTATALVLKAGGGAMVAMFLPEMEAKSLALDGGERPEDLHMTLAYLGRLDELPEGSRERMLEAVQRFVSTRMERPLSAKISGVGRFSASNSSDGQDVVYLSVDAPWLPELRQALVDELSMSGVPIRRDHGFSPHITLAYVPADHASPLERMEPVEVEFSAVTAAYGGERHVISLKAAASDSPDDDVAWETLSAIIKADEDQRLVTGIVLQPDVVDAQGDIISAEAIRVAAHDFLAAYNHVTRLGLQHSAFPPGMRLVESYIAPVQMTLGNRKIRKGTWMVTVHVQSDTIWDAVKSGKLRGFSVGGVAKVERL